MSNSNLAAIKELAKKELLSPSNTDNLAIALAHYLFRDSPIEDMHADGQLSQDDMKKQNKYVVNQIATVLRLAHGERWDFLYTLLGLYMMNGEGWDAPEIDMEGLKSLFGEDFTL